jgi:hypothetical protein
MTAFPISDSITLRARADQGITVAHDEPVGTWTGIVGSLDATYALESERPRYRTDGLHGRPFLRFTRSASRQMRSEQGTSSREHTVVAVWVQRGATTGFSRAIQGRDGNWLLGHRSEGPGIANHANGWVSTGANEPTQIGDMYYAVARNGAAGANLRVNGVDRTVSASPSGHPGRLALGAGGQWNEPDDFDLHELVVLTRRLTDSEAEAVEAYAQAEWIDPPPVFGVQHLGFSRDEAATPPADGDGFVFDEATGLVVPVRQVAGDGIDSIVKVTQAQYDALSPPDPDTLYVIV